MQRLLLTSILICLIPLRTTYASDNIVNPDEVYSYEILVNDLKELEERYKKQLRIISIGQSHFGREIWALKLGKGNKNILFIGAHHGREWLTTSLLMKMVEQYAENYENQKKYGNYSSSILDEVSIWFVPMLNPDGVMIQQEGLRSILPCQQKNLMFMNLFSFDFSSWKANGIGIDLNRQYSAGWNEIKEDSPIPFYKGYKGKIPFEAKEVQHITQFTKKISPLMAVAYHTSGREIFWKYHNGKNIGRDKDIAEKVSDLTGYKRGIPPEDAFGGGYTDWFITTFHQPGLTIELCPLIEETNPPIDNFKEEWDRNKFLGIFLAWEAYNLHKKQTMEETN